MKASKAKYTERHTLIKHFIDEIGSYMKPKDFQRPLYESIESQFAERGDLTDKQINVLKNIYERLSDI